MCPGSPGAKQKAHSEYSYNLPSFRSRIHVLSFPVNLLAEDAVFGRGVCPAFAAVAFDAGFCGCWSWLNLQSAPNLQLTVRKPAVSRHGCSFASAALRGFFGGRPPEGLPASPDFCYSAAYRRFDASAATAATVAYRPASSSAASPWQAALGYHAYRLGSLQERMELIKAVEEQDVEKVEVRRILEAVSSTEYGPSRAVCLGLGQWTLDAVVARPIRLCQIQPCVRHQSGNFDAACRRSSVPVRTSSSVTRTLPCRLAESPDFSPPPSPAITVSATF